MSNLPNHETHEPVHVDLPPEEVNLIVGRPDAPTPNLWQKSVKVVRLRDGKEAIVNTIDYATMMFRAFYPDEGDVIDGKPQGRFAERTEWEHCKDWRVEVVYSKREMERQKARDALELEMTSLDKDSLAAVSILCDHDDPQVALGKLEALRRLGLVKNVAATGAAIVEMKPTKK